MVRVVLISILFLSSLKLSAQLGVQFYAESNSISRPLDANFIYQLGFKGNFEVADNYMGQANTDSRLSFQNYQSLNLSLFDSLPANQQWGFEFVNFSEAYASMNLFYMALHGNQPYPEASLDDLSVRGYQVSNLTFSPSAFNPIKNSSIRLKFKLGLVHNYYSLKNTEGVIETRNDGQEIFIDYDYQLINSFNKIAGINAGADLSFKYNSEKWSYSVLLKDIGLFYLNAVNTKQQTGDTLYEGPDLVDLISGEDTESIGDYFFNGDTSSTLQLSAVQLFAAANRSLNNSFLDELGVFYRSYSLRGDLHSIGVSLKKDFKANSSLEARIASGTMQRLELGLYYALQLGKHKFLLGSHQVMAPILPTFTPGIQFSIQYQYLP